MTAPFGPCGISDLWVATDVERIFLQKAKRQDRLESHLRCKSLSAWVRTSPRSIHRENPSTSVPVRKPPPASCLQQPAPHRQTIDIQFTQFGGQATANDRRWSCIFRAVRRCQGECPVGTLVGGVEVSLRIDVIEQFARLTFEDGAHPG